MSEDFLTFYTKQCIKKETIVYHNFFYESYDVQVYFTSL